MQPIENLKEAFAQFRLDPYNRFVVAVRHTRAQQIRHLFASSEAMTLKTFEQEIWNIETETYLRSLDLHIAIFKETKNAEYIEQLVASPSIFHASINWTMLEDALVSGDLELHGNYIWRQGSHGYDITKAKSEAEKVAQIRRAITLLNGADKPMIKVEQIRKISGFGENNATGLVMMFHPNDFALVNKVTRKALELLDISQDASKLSIYDIQSPLTQLKAQLGAQDFVELDWFLYLITEGKYGFDEPENISSGTWRDYIERVLRNVQEPLNYTEITDQVLALGLKTKRKTPVRTVSRILATNPQLFEHVDRGKYRLVETDKSLPSGDVGEDSLESEVNLVLPPDYVEPSFDVISTSVREQGMHIDERTLRSYHLALKTGRIVVLAGPSGTGKTWLAQAYADAVAAAPRLISVAPNWTTNEDLLGYTDPLDQSIYHHTDTSQFLLSAAQEYEQAVKFKLNPRPYHLILDEMNLARVEYYFAKFLSIMEVRARKPDQAFINLGPSLTVSLYPNLSFIGTINVDDTTHAFAEKVYDRAHVIRLSLSYVALAQAVGDVPYKQMLMRIWEDISPIAPFAFRVIDDIEIYMREAAKLNVPWRESLDDLVQQKILPKVRGFDQKVGIALNKLTESVSKDDLPLSHACVQEMLKGYEDHGTASFF